jgi:hypothetical protein
VGFCEDGTALVAHVVETVQKRVARKRSKGSDVETLFRYRVTAWREGAVWQSEPSEPIGTVDFVQSWQDKLLLVGSWCEQRRAGPVPNAHLIEWSGERLRSWLFGLGINDVRAGRDRVWCSYLDQGVLAYDGWGPGGESMGGSGVRAFDRNGVPQSLAGALAGESVVDVYALNVCADDDVWIYAYTQFDLLRLYAGELRTFAAGVAGARALCIRGSRALFVGEYGRPNRVVERSLDGRASFVERALSLPSTWESSGALRVRGHRHVLWLWDEQRVGRARDW